MMSTDAVIALIGSMRGSRPQSLDGSEVEEVLNISLALLIELCASNDRIDRLERVIAESSETSLEAFRDQHYDGAIAGEREQATNAMLARVLRILMDPRTPVDGAAAP